MDTPMNMSPSDDFGVTQHAMNNWVPFRELPISACAGLIIAALTLVIPLYRALFSPLRAVPGPPTARFSSLWYLWRLYRGHFEEENLVLHKKYGPVVQLSPNRYSFSHPDALTAIYGPSAAKVFPKSSSYRPAAPPDPQKWTLFADENIQRHANHRRLYQSTYSMSSLVTYQSYVDECVDLLSLRLSELADAGIPVDIGYWFQCFAFDVIGLITYSQRLGFLDNGDDIGGIIKTIDDEMVYFVLVGVYNSLHRFIFPIRNWLAGKKGTGRTYLMNFTKDKVAEHQARPHVMTTEDAEAKKAPLDFLSKFLGNHLANPAKFTMYHVFAGCASNIVAGSDTTATSLSGIIYHLLKNPKTLQQLREEIDESPEKKDGGSSISWAESQGLPYLQAVIKEALRLHTAVALPMERVVPKKGAVICGHHFPEGTHVGINNWVYHRNTAIFGQDAEEFKPERWLTDNREQLALMNKHLVSFGAGARTCIGRHIAALQMSKLISRLIRDFDLTLCDEVSEPSREWVTRNYFFLKPSNFRVCVTLRQKKST